MEDVKLGGPQVCPACKTLNLAGLYLPFECVKCSDVALSPELRTPDEWAEEMNFEVIDPDGWRWKCGDLEPRPYSEEITRKEFNVRAIRSTIMPRHDYPDYDECYRNPSECYFVAPINKCVMPLGIGGCNRHLKKPSTIEKNSEGSSNVVSLKDYTPADKIKHVTFSRMEIEQTYECPTCGPLQVVSGVCIHIKPEEDHEG